MKTKTLWIAAAAGVAFFFFWRAQCSNCAARSTAAQYNAYAGPYRDWQ